MALFSSALVLGSVCCPLPGVCGVSLYMKVDYTSPQSGPRTHNDPIDRPATAPTTRRLPFSTFSYSPATFHTLPKPIEHNKHRRTSRLANKRRIVYIYDYTNPVSDLACKRNLVALCTSMLLTSTWTACRGAVLVQAGQRLQRAPMPARGAACHEPAICPIALGVGSCRNFDEL